MIHTFTLILSYTDSRGYHVERKFENISRVAVDRFTEYYFYKTDYTDVSYDLIKWEDVK